MSEPASVRFGRFRFQREGRRGLVELDDVARVQLGPVLSDMDQSEADAHLVLPSGFIFRDARIVNTDQCEVTLPGLEFHHANSTAFFSEVEYNVCLERRQSLKSFSAFASRSGSGVDSDSCADGTGLDF